MPDTRGNDERREKNKARVSHTAGSTYKVDSKHEVEAVGPGHGVRVREGRKATPQTGATPGRGNSLSCRNGGRTHVEPQGVKTLLPRGL